jgi:AcrR family transcriptional regulator
MGRWEGGADGRLREAAMQLYAERGFEQTTVADIAERAGLTARTFFRYFADKREVLFAGSDALREAMVAALESAPGTATAMQAVAVSLDAAAGLIGGSHEHSRQRWAIITAHPELAERELKKMSALATALAGALRARGVAEPAATLAAEAGIVVLRVGYERWVAGPGGTGLADEMRGALDHLREVTR